MVVGCVFGGDFAEPGAFVEAATGEGDGEGFEAAGGYFGSVVEDGGGIDASRCPDAEGDVGDEVFADGVCQESVELVFGVGEGEFGVGVEAELPVGFRVLAAVLPFEEVSGGERLDAFN